MRFYAFSNFMLSSIQQSIQATHCLADMFVKYQDPCEQRDVLYSWATDHKTMIVLNGGNSQDIQQTYDFVYEFSVHSILLPFALFKEDMSSLNEAVTCFGMIVPALIYEAADDLRKNHHTVISLGLTGKLNIAQIKIAEILSYASLAR